MFIYVFVPLKKSKVYFLTKIGKKSCAHPPALAYIKNFSYLCPRKLNITSTMAKATITKAEIAEHFVTVDQLHEDLTNMVHNYYAQGHSQQQAAI